MDRRPQFTLRALIATVVVLATALALGVPLYWRSRLERNERHASAQLKVIAAAQAEFRSNDRDGNLVNDFWTADVYGLHGARIIGPIEHCWVPGDHDDMSDAIRLIEPRLASADGLSRTDLYDNVRFEAAGVRGGADHGYILRVFASQDDGAGATTLLNDTDGQDFMGAVHDRSRFAFMAFPLTRWDGRTLFMINADQTVLRYALPDTYAATLRPLGPGDSSSRIVGTGSSHFDMTDSSSGVYPQPRGASLFD